MKIDVSCLDERLQKIAEELAPEIGIDTGEHGIPVVCENCAEGFEIYPSNSGEIVIAYDKNEPVTFCRAFGYLKQVERTGKPVKEKPKFDKLRYMADMSRNGMMNVPTAKKMMRNLALMGYNDFSLYLEDGYSIPGYPYFGYERSRYSESDIKELIEYGELLGLTITPCVQTLAHLKNPLQWSAMRELKDTDSVLYVGSEKTYQFLDAMIGQLTKIFKTRKFNVGMDEAHGLGLGKKLDKEGLKNKSELMRQHLETVGEICRRHGVEPMIWSDMFFRPFESDGGYYSATVDVPQEVIDGVPEDFTLIYWDYYTLPDTEASRASFDNMLAQHKRFKNPIAFAGGTWLWVGFTPENTFSEHVGEYHVRRCIEEGIRDISVTAWGDDGSESSVFSALVAPLIYGDRLYGKEDSLNERFEDLFGIALDDYKLLDTPDFVPDAPDPRLKASKNPSKYLFYADPICGKLDAHVLPSYKEHFARERDLLLKFAGHRKWGYIFKNLSDLCAVLALKATFGIEAREAYAKGDKKALLALADRAELAADLTLEFRDSTRDRWYKEYKLYGFETLEMRLGGVRQRLLGTAETLRRYVDGRLESLDMMTEQLLPMDPRAVGKSNVLTTYEAAQAFPATCKLT
ncbi:MAG: beta-N-acetylhexosaminidase [Clostridia bacterium]|nr:beta-N-acetylhexosaminidase [Clostridia bacterium]